MPYAGTPAGDRMTKAGKNLPSKAPDNCYPTSILSLVSAVLKLARHTKIPPGRTTWRGLGAIQLDYQWFLKDERGVTTGVELGFMSTTLDPGVATEYSGVQRGKAGTVMEFEVGAVDLGAQLEDLSQYPGEWCFQ